MKSSKSDTIAVSDDKINTEIKNNFTHQQVISKENNQNIVSKNDDNKGEFFRQIAGGVISAVLAIFLMLILNVLFSFILSIFFSKAQIENIFRLGVLLSMISGILIAGRAAYTEAKLKINFLGFFIGVVLLFILNHYFQIVEIPFIYNPRDINTYFWLK